jgi:hypothetical protein
MSLALRRPAGPSGFRRIIDHSTSRFEAAKARQASGFCFEGALS